MLTVSSVPVTGVLIEGNNTDYTAEFEEGQVVNLVAPTTAAVAGTSYTFIRWMVDGVGQPDGVADVQVTMDIDHTLVAVYEIQRHTLTVQSMLVTTSTGRLPVIGVPIAGDAPGSTNYTVTCDDGQTVTLLAPRYFQMTGSAGTVDYAFQRWSVDGVDQSWEYLDVQIEMRADHTVVAKYSLASDCDTSCSVNVLDMLRIRSALGQNVYTGENWRMDINFDKRINLLDLLAARNRLNKACLK